jgi:hypothetical protein
MSDILLLISEEAHARELSRVADYLRKASDLRPVYFVEDRMRPFGIHDKLAASGIETLTSDEFAADNARPAARVRNGWRWASTLITFMQGIAPRLRWGSGRLLSAFLQIGSARDQMLRRSVMCEAVLSRRCFAALLLCEDNIELDTAVWIEAARKRGIRSIIVPYTMANTVELTEAYVFAAPYQVHASFANRLVARIFPKWVTRHKGRRFMRASYAKIVAVEMLGLTPPNPWLLNSGFADAIAVESVAMHEYYRAAGLPANQLVMTGTLPDDVMFENIANASNLRYAFLTEIGLPPDRPLLLCAFPPDDNRYERPGVEFSHFEEQLRFWGETFAAVQGWNIIIVPHPKTRIEQLDTLRKYGLTLSRRDTASLIPLCDLYVASASATIRWAIACGKPVINYDVFRLEFHDYDHLEGVALAKTCEEFRRALSALTGDPAEFSRIRAIQQREASRWGFRDGLSGRRMLALIRGETFAPPIMSS